MTKTKSKTHIAVTVGILLAGGAAAFALLGNPGVSGYSKLSVECYDGSTLVEENGSYIMMIEGQRFEGRSFACAPASIWNQNAEEFCRGRVNPETGKSGINSMSITKKCTIPFANPRDQYGYNTPTPPPANYGYGYNTSYGYNRGSYGYNSSYGYNASTITTQHPKTSFGSKLKFWKK